VLESGAAPCGTARAPECARQADAQQAVAAPAQSSQCMGHPASRRADSPPPEPGFGAATYPRHAGTGMRRRPDPRRRPMQPQACSVGSSCQKPYCCGPPIGMDGTSTPSRPVWCTPCTPCTDLSKSRLLRSNCWSPGPDLLAHGWPFWASHEDGCSEESVLIRPLGPSIEECGELMMQGQRCRQGPLQSIDAGAPQGPARSSWWLHGTTWVCMQLFPQTHDNSEKSRAGAHTAPPRRPPPNNTF